MMMRMMRMRMTMRMMMRMIKMMLELTPTQSSARDPASPEFNRCRVFSQMLGSSSDQPSEQTPIIARTSQSE